jgi:hypothetical protein
MIVKFHGYTIRIDKEDYPLLMRNIQEASIKNGWLYIGDRPFHRLIIGDPTTSGGLRQNIRFKNNNKLDVRKANLLVGSKQDRWRNRLLDIDTVSNQPSQTQTQDENTNN